MKFKNWLNEIVSPQKPLQPRKSTIIKNKSSNTAKPVLQYTWKTSLGNKVELQFDKNYEDSYVVIFYVNGTHYDDETSGENRTRDPEVLNTVIFMMKKVADQLGAKELSFTGQDSPRDYKKLFNMPLEPTKTNLLATLKDIVKTVESRTPQMIPPTQKTIDIYTKLKRPIPSAKLDFDPKNLNIIKNVISDVEANRRIPEFFSFFQELKNLGFDFLILEKQIRIFNQIIQSRTEEGWTRHKNRRAEVFEKLVKKFFGDWTIERLGNKITLTR